MPQVPAPLEKKGNVGQMAMEMFNVSLLITRRWTDFHFLWGKKEMERLKKKSKRDKNAKQGHLDPPPSFLRSAHKILFFSSLARTR